MEGSAQNVVPAAHGWLAGIFFWFLHLGFGGLLLLAALDSGPLFLPLANDLLLIVLVSLHHTRLLLYVGAATVGSLLGSYLMYLVGDKGGERFLQAHISGESFRRLRERVAHRGPVVLAIPALIPPPFPFTVSVLAAGALEVPRRRFLIALGAFRFLRYLAEALFALVYGRLVVRWMESAFFRHLIEALMLLALAGSAYSIYKLVKTVRRSRRAPGAAAEAGAAASRRGRATARRSAKR